MLIVWAPLYEKISVNRRLDNILGVRVHFVHLLFLSSSIEINNNVCSIRESDGN